MRKWKCIDTPLNSLTVGKIYETNNEGFELINNNGKIHSSYVSVMDYKVSKFEEVNEKFGRKVEII